MKTAFRFLGIGFLLSALLLLGLKYSNILNDESYSFSIPFLTKNASVETSAVQTSEIKVSDTITTTSSVQQTETTNAETTTQVETRQEITTTNSEEIKITINSNDYSDVVIKKLVDSGVITDGSGFYNYIVSNKLDTILQNGTFTLKKGMSFEELGKILTTYPGN